MPAPKAAAVLLAELQPKARAMRPMAMSYCALKAIADGIRADVDKVQRRLLLEECPLFKDLSDGGRVIDPKDAWLSEQDDAFKAYVAAQDRELRAAGIKPPEMGDEYCPALVAENAAVKARGAIIDALAPLVGIERGCLFGENEERFFELAMGLLLNA
jgi:hypothetical protein